jgi:hypothetical protein
MHSCADTATCLSNASKAPWKTLPSCSVTCGTNKRRLCSLVEKGTNATRLLQGQRSVDVQSCLSSSWAAKGTRLALTLSSFPKSFLARSTALRAVMAQPGLRCHSSSVKSKTQEVVQHADRELAAPKQKSTFQERTDRVAKTREYR